MSHPETYYEAKAAFLAAMEECRAYLPANTVEALLGSLGWVPPAPARDSRGKLVKVFHVEDLKYVLPWKFMEEHPLPAGAVWYGGVVAGASKTDVADRTMPSWARSGRSKAVQAVPVTDLRYPLAVAYPHKIVVQAETIHGDPVGERHLVSLGALRLEDADRLTHG